MMPAISIRSPRKSGITPLLASAQKACWKPRTAMEIYLNNPVTIAVLGFQQAFWAEASNGVMPDFLGERMLIAGIIGLALLLLAQRVFAKLQGNFAQEL